MNRTTSLVFTSASLLFAACSGSDERPLSQAEYEEVAQSVGGVLAMDRGQLGAVSHALSIARGDIPVGFRVSASGQVEGEHGGLEYSFDLTCADAAGDELAVC